VINPATEVVLGEARSAARTMSLMPR